MSTGMNFTCISAFDASKDIIWSFSYKIEDRHTGLGGAGFTTFLNYLSAQTGGGKNYGMGYGPSSTVLNDGVDGNFLVAGFDNSGYFGTSAYGFSTGLAAPKFNSLTVRKDTTFEYLTSQEMTSFYIKNTNWQTLRFQLTNKGNIFKVFYCDSEFNYKLVSEVQTLSTFLSPTKMYIGMSYASPIQGGDDFKLSIRDFHCYGNPLP